MKYDDIEWMNGCELCNTGICNQMNEYIEKEEMGEREASRKMAEECEDLWTASQIYDRFRYHTNKKKSQKTAGKPHNEGKTAGKPHSKVSVMSSGTFLSKVMEVVSNKKIEREIVKAVIKEAEEKIAETKKGDLDKLIAEYKEATK